MYFHLFNQSFFKSQETKIIYAFFFSSDEQSRLFGLSDQLDDDLPLDKDDIHQYRQTVDLQLRNLLHPDDSDMRLVQGQSVEQQFQMLLHKPKPIPPPVNQEPQEFEVYGGEVILAEQIDNEILELRNFFEDHREEMMSMLHEPNPTNQSRSLPLNPTNQSQRGHTPNQTALQPAKPNRRQNGGSQGRSDTDTRSVEYPVHHSAVRDQNRFGNRFTPESDSDAAAAHPPAVQLRRIEFEKRRMRKELRKRKRRLRLTGYSGENQTLHVENIKNSRHADILDQRNARSLNLENVRSMDHREVQSTQADWQGSFRSKASRSLDFRYSLQLSVCMESLILNWFKEWGLLGRKNVMMLKCEIICVRKKNLGKGIF